MALDGTWPCDSPARALGQRPQRVSQADEPDPAGEFTGRQVETDFEVVAIPPQALDDASALFYQVIAVVNGQAHVVLGTGEYGVWQVGLTECGPGHARRIDRVGRAVAARRGPDSCHHLGRDAHNALSPSAGDTARACRRRDGSPRSRSSTPDQGPGPTKGAPRAPRRRRSRCAHPRRAPWRRRVRLSCGSSYAGRSRLRSSLSPFAGCQMNR